MDATFVEQYDKDMEVFHKVRAGSVDKINAGVIDAYHEYQRYADSQRMELRDMSQVSSENDDTLQMHGFSRHDLSAGNVPWYVETKLQQETPAETYDENIKKAQRELFKDVYHVDSVLTDDTRKLLGREYRDYWNEQQLQDTRASVSHQFSSYGANNAQRQRSGSRTVFEDENGDSYQSLVSPNGHAVRGQDADYGFDEFD